MDYKFSFGASVAIFVLNLVAMPSLSAQEVYSNYEERLGSRSTPVSQSIDGSFGAKTNIATGGISFSVPVLSIPGDNGLDIAVSYKLAIRSIGGATEWYFEEDEPYLSGSFSDSAGWTTVPGGASRCSMVNSLGWGPPNVPSSDGMLGSFYTDEYWYGYFLSLPGGGARLNKISASTAGVPATGEAHHWATNDHWYFSCIALSNGVGEGFLGYSPDGLKYYFNKMRDGLWLPALNKINHGGKDTYLERREVRIYAGRVEDRFGNYITGLSASDGRAVVKAESGGNIVYSYGGRQWIVRPSNPFTVTYPDGSVWRAEVSGNINNYVSLKNNCPGDSRVTSPSTTTVSVQTPAGVVGTYTLKQVLLGYSYVGGECAPLDDGGNTVDRSSVAVSPALIKRVVSGPGLVPLTVDIDYGSSNDCYSNSNYWFPKCTSSSPTWRTVTYNYSDGRYKKYKIGNKEWVDSDLILKLEEGQGSQLPSRTTEYFYSTLPAIGSDVGTFGHSVQDVKRVVLIKKNVLVDDQLFTWAVATDCGGGTSLCVDEYGRPTKTTSSTTQ